MKQGTTPQRNRAKPALKIRHCHSKKQDTDTDGRVFEKFDAAWIALPFIAEDSLG